MGQGTPSRHPFTCAPRAFQKRALIVARETWSFHRGPGLQRFKCPRFGRIQAHVSRVSISEKSFFAGTLRGYPQHDAHLWTRSRNVKPSGLCDPAFWGFWGYVFREAVSGGPSRGESQCSKGFRGRPYWARMRSKGVTFDGERKRGREGTASPQRKSALFPLFSETSVLGSGSLVRSERLPNAVLHRKRTLEVCRSPYGKPRCASVSRSVHSVHRAEER